MIVRCAWCQKIVRNKPPYGAKYDSEITDGICSECFVEQMEFIEIRKDHNLDSVTIPNRRN